MIRGLTVAMLLSAGAALAQNEARSSFEAASVKPVELGRPSAGYLHGGPGTNSPGQITGAASMKALLIRAYDLKSYQISGPPWMDSERYEIAAKLPDGASKEQVPRMWQSLLAERFHLVAHRETRELPIYALVVGKNGPKFKPSPPPDQKASAAAAAAAEDGTLASRDTPKLIKGPDGFPDLAPGVDVPRSYQVVVGGSDGILYKLWARRETMHQLADLLSSQLNRAVIDRTALPGKYDYALTWTIENHGAGVPRTDPPPDEIDFFSGPILSDPGLSVFTAIQSQLGLRLEQRRGPLEMLIVDAIDKTPSGN